jgi:hypothetical protein
MGLFLPSLLSVFDFDSSFGALDIPSKTAQLSLFNSSCRRSKNKDLIILNLDI